MEQVFMNVPLAKLKTILKECIEEVQSESLAYKRAQTEFPLDTPLKIDDVTEITGYSKPTLYGYVQRNEIPYHKKGNRLYFFRCEIINWIKTGKQKSLKELEAEADLYLSNKKKGLN